jgi:2-methylcitrate dehydratase PrpD
LDAIQDLIREKNLTEEDIERVVIETFRNAVDGHGEIAPDTVVGATMSYPYCVALMFLTGKVSISDFTEERLANAKFIDKVKQIGKKVVLIINPEIEKEYPDKYIAKVTLHGSGGAKYERVVTAAKGFYPENPVGDEEMKEKFRGLATQKLPEERVEWLIQQIENLEKIDDIRKIISALR